MRLLVLASATAIADPSQSRVPPAVRFKANAGQADSRAQFVARSSRYTVFLTTAGAVLSPGVRIRFVDSNPAQLEGESPFPGVVTNPAAVGSTITFYATGAGQTIPPGIEGVLHRSARAAPVNPASVYIAGQYVSGPQYYVGSLRNFQPTCLS